MNDFNPMTMPLNGTQLIEASAGTGKTYTITNLFLRLLLGRDEHYPQPLPVSAILVLTFTIAATDELKHRITKRIRQARDAFRTGTSDDHFLAQLLAGSTDSLRDMKLLAAASQLMDEAAIFTIHGFCARVLGEQAFEYGALFNQELNAERNQLLQQASEDCFRTDALTLQPAWLRDIALGLWSTPEKLAKDLSPLLFRGKLSFHPPRTATDPAALERLAGDVQRLWISEDIASLLFNCDLKTNMNVFKRLSAMTAFCESGQPDLTHELWDIYRTESVNKAVKKSGATPEHPVFSMIDKITDETRLLRTNLWHQMYERMLALINHQKSQFNQFTIDDLLTSLASAVNREGSQLPMTIASRWPVAMIDEFQDTDPIQASIFNRIYQPEQVDNTLLMIGDPKQAIYQFRGADVFTYINARRRASDIHTLTVNWRSSPEFVEATNFLFDLPAVFDNDEDIPFAPVEAAEPNREMAMTIAGIKCLPYCLFHVGETTRNWYAGEIRDPAMNWAAEETARLLNPDSDARLDNAPVNAGQIAFLVRTRRDAEAARAALAARNIQSVYLTLESVFLQETARDLKLILEAALEPTSDRAIRSALGTRLMQTPAAEIDAMSRDVILQQQVHAEFMAYHQLWEHNDVAPMLNNLVKVRGIAEKWLSLPDGEREITNLRHLTELLQQRSSQSQGMFQLIKWFEKEQREAETVSSEERQLRLESDEHLVKIVTMHAAKGLEYDIVMVPMPVFGSHGGNNLPALFHEDQQGEFVSAVELGEDPDHRASSEQEELAEEMRLLYVAVTRARYRCYLGLPKMAALNQSAFRKLLRIDKYDAKFDLRAHANQMLPAALFEVVDGNSAPLSRYSPPGTSHALVPPPERPQLHDRWSMHSYTAVASRLATETAHVIGGFSDDDTFTDQDPETGGRMTRFTFPRGARAGVVLHSLMEEIDFRDPDSLQEACSRTLGKLGLDDPWLPVLTTWLDDILDADMAGTRLRDIDRANRIDEMEFHFPLATDTSLVGFLREKHLVHADTTRTLELEGMMTGLVDLLYRVDNRYYIVDYKSNYLGRQASDYSPDAILSAMNEHQYHLQYMIYTVALQRMLRHRLPGYDFETHFGGVHYLFLRGMSAGSDNGIFHARPDLELIEALDAKLGGTR